MRLQAKIIGGDICKSLFVSLLLLISIRCLRAQDKHSVAETAERVLMTDQQSDQLEKARQLHDAGITLLASRKFPEAKEKLLECLAIRKDVLGEDLQTALSHSYVAIVCGRQGDYREAEKHYEQALVIYEKRRGLEHRETALALHNAGSANQSLGNDDKARERFEKALSIFEKLGLAETKDTALTRSYLGVSYKNLGKFEESEEQFQKSLAILQTNDTNDKTSIAKVHNNLAVLYIWWGQYDQARRKNRESLETLKDAGHQMSENMATLLFNEALVNMVTGDTVQAEVSYLKALEIFKKELGETHPYTAQTRSELGLLYFGMGNLAKARSELEQSLKVLEQRYGAENRHVVRIRANLALVEQGDGKMDEAEKKFKDCLECRIKHLGPDHPETAASFCNLGQLYQESGNLQQAEASFQSSLAIQQRTLGNRHGETAESLDRLGLVEFSLGRTERAIQLIGESLSIRRQLLDVTADVQSERQQLQMFQNVRKTLDHWISLTGVDNTAAYSQVLRWKGNVFIRQKAIRDSQHASNSELAPLVKALRDVSCRLAKRALSTPKDGQELEYQQELQKLSGEREQIEARLSEKNSARRKSHELATITSDELRTAVPPKTALIDFLEYDRFIPSKGETKDKHERQFVAFLLRSDRQEIQRFELGAAKIIDDLVDDWHRLCRDTEDSPLKNPAQELYRRIWLPLAPHLDGIETVLLSPDGSLGKLPFAALPEGTKLESYLLEKLAIVTIPVPQSLLGMIQQKVGVQPEPDNEPELRMLVVGGINYDAAAKPVPTTTKKRRGTRASSGEDLNEKYEPLLATKAEGATIARAAEKWLGKNNVEFLDEDIPTKDVIREKAPTYNYLHFATHGFFATPKIRSVLDARNDNDSRSGSSSDELGQHLGLPSGVLSGLALAGANNPQEGEDGILTALEVEGLDLSRAKLVVLSACETGLGRVAGGEGVLGLQRSFQLAGARSVLATLWKVNDVRTQELITSFYDKYTNPEKYLDSQGEPLTTIECFRQAQLDMLKQPPENRGVRLGNQDEKVTRPRMQPYFWAGFVLSGDWR